MQGTLLSILALIFICFLFLLWQIVHGMEKNGNKYAKKVLTQQSYVSNAIQYKRGDILDRNNTKLATSKLLYNVIIDPKTILSKDGYEEETVNALTSCFDVEADEVKKIIKDRPKSQYYVLLKNIEKASVEKFNEQVDAEKQRAKKKKEQCRIVGVTFEKVYKRNYPLNEKACSVVGFSSANNEGLWGLENQYNDLLNGVCGRSYGYYSADGELVKTVKSAQNGNSIVTTIDSNIQAITEKKINKFMKETGAKNVAALVMNPKNGEIYAMASNKQYDLNNAFDLSQVYSEKEIKKLSEKEKTEKLNEMWSNFCVSYAYEPGSTYKPMTVAAALDENIVKDGQSFVCDGGETISGVHISCVSRFGHGNLTLEQSLMESCNDVMMQIASKMGKKTFYKYQSIFNIGRKTGIDLPGETSGSCYNEDTLGPTELATSSFGQSLTTNMVQIASAFSSVINGGSYYKPHLVKQVLDDNGNIVENIEPTLVRKTVSEQTSAYLRKYLKATVEDGTAATAAIPGYSIGGKTGTAQKFPRKARKYLVSFIGAAPMDDPEVVVYVIVDEANVEDQAHSTYAQEVVRNIMKDILPFLGVYKDEKAAKNADKKENGDTTTGATTAPTSTDTPASSTPQATQQPAKEEDTEGYDLPDTVKTAPTPEATTTATTE